MSPSPPLYLLVVDLINFQVFGIDNLTGEIVWRFLVDMEPLGPSHAPTYAMFSMRSPIHMPHPAQMAVLARSHSGDGVLVVFNPITGTYGARLLE